jgi:hypothetical protein
LPFCFSSLVQSATADDWDQRTIFTFSGPVEIPGQALSAGTYVFKLADSTSNRNIVQVFSKDEKHLYGTFLAIPDARLQPAGKPIITFDETPAGSPDAVRAWFYPGPPSRLRESERHSQFPVADEILQQNSSGRFEHLGSNRACPGDRDTELTPLDKEL